MSELSTLPVPPPSFALKRYSPSPALCESMMPARTRSHSASNPTSPLVTSASIVTSVDRRLEPAGGDPSPCGVGRPSSFSGSRREMEAAAEQEVVPRQLLRRLRALRSVRPCGQCERIVGLRFGERSRCPGEWDTADGHVRSRAAFQALAERVDHWRADGAPKRPSMRAASDRSC